MRKFLEELSLAGHTRTALLLGANQTELLAKLIAELRTADFLGELRNSKVRELLTALEKEER